MVKRYLILAMVLILVVGLMGGSSVVADGPDSAGPQPFYRDDDTIDIGPVLRNKDLPIAGLSGISAEQMRQSLRAEAYTVGDQVSFLALDDYYGQYFITTYTVVTITQHAEVWVQNDLNYYHPDGSAGGTSQPNPTHPDAKDPEYVTAERINELATAFDDIIHPTNTGFFGAYDSHDGTYALLSIWGYAPPGYYSGDGDKVVILVSNVRDTNFYDPVASSSYIAGFYSPTFEAYADRNMITIDSKQWNERVGGSGSRPYVYDSTLAHELQHLIHDDWSGNEESWVNEGMSGLSEFLNGYWVTDALGDRTQWQQWPENSLVQWGDQPSEILADYQLVNAFMIYTTGRIGGVYTDTARLTQESEDGILGYNAWLSDISVTNPDAVGLTFGEIFEDFRRDMLYDGGTNDAEPTGRWNADFIDAYVSPIEKSGGPSSSEADLGVLRENLDSEGYSTPGVPPFGTDFIEICWSSGLGEVEFDGDESAPPTAWSVITATEIYSPTSGGVTGDVLYSGHSNLEDNWVIFGPVGVNAADDLTFDHYYNIEDDWDYGFVQVTTDTTGMSGWTSLAITGTVSITDAHAHKVVKANVPGFSGFSGGWMTATYDIGAEYDGEQVLLAFRYATDWSSAGSSGDDPPGWAIDNVQVGSTVLTDGALGSARSIQQVRNAGNKFAFEFLTWDGVGATTLHTVTLSAEMTGTLDLAALGDTNFDQAGESGVFMVTLMLDAYDDLIAGGVLPKYADYALTGMPASICTSDVTAWSREGERVYAGEVVTATVHADNLGSSPNITATGPISFYIGVEVPADTTYAATDLGTYVADLSTIAASFPAVPGVYWSGTVESIQDFDAGFTADSGVVSGDRITVTAHFASDDTASPTQYFADTDAIRVVSAFGLSAMVADVDPVLPGTTAEFTVQVLNLADYAKATQLVADVPTDTNFVEVTGATNVVSSTSQVTVTETITPYAEGGSVGITFKWQLGPSYDFGDTITSTVKLVDVTTGEVFDLSATADVGAVSRIYLPVTMKSYSAP